MDPADGLPAAHCKLCVQGMMNTWTLQMGYPLVTVTSVCRVWWTRGPCRWTTRCLWYLCVQGMMNSVDPSDGLPAVIDTSVCWVWWTGGPFRWTTCCLWYLCVQDLMNMHVYPSDGLTAWHCYLCVQGMMNTWTLQMGYPLVTFSLLDNSSSTWLISQSRFLLSAQVSIFWLAVCQMHRDDKLLLASVPLNITIYNYPYFLLSRSLLYLFNITKFLWSGF